MWERWCTTRGITALTADPAVLCAYLVERAASGIAITILDLACTAIRHVHRTHGLVDPAEDETVRQIRLGLRRTYGTAPRRLARPLTVAEIGRILVAIDRTKPAGSLLTVRQSKTDQEGHGQVVAVAHGTQAATDPVAALAAWLNERGSEPGVLFTRIWQTSKDRAMTSPWGEVPSNTYVPTSDGRRVANS